MTAVISVILPVRNRELSISASIKSVLDQDFTDFELVVIDDCSTDSTADVVKSFKDSRLRLLELPVNVGVSAARNRGVSASEGEFIAFLDSDDIYLKEKLTKQKKFFEAIKCSNLDRCHAVCCQIAYYKSSGELLRVKPLSESGDSISLISCLEVCEAPPQTWLISRSAFDLVGGFDDSLRKNGDAEFLIRFLNNFRMEILPEPLVQLQRVDVSISMRDDPRSSFKAIKNNRMSYLHHAKDLYLLKCKRLFFEAMKSGDFECALELIKEISEITNKKTVVALFYALCWKGYNKISGNLFK